MKHDSTVYKRAAAFVLTILTEYCWSSNGNTNNGYVLTNAAGNKYYVTSSNLFRIHAAYSLYFQGQYICSFNRGNCNYEIVTYSDTFLASMSQTTSQANTHVDNSISKKQKQHLKYKKFLEDYATERGIKLPKHFTSDWIDEYNFAQISQSAKTYVNNQLEEERKQQEKIWGEKYQYQSDKNSYLKRVVTLFNLTEFRSSASDLSSSSIAQELFTYFNCKKYISKSQSTDYWTVFNSLNDKLSEKFPDIRNQTEETVREKLISDLTRQLIALKITYKEQKRKKLKEQEKQKAIKIAALENIKRKFKLIVKDSQGNFISLELLTGKEYEDLLIVNSIQNALVSSFNLIPYRDAHEFKSEFLKIADIKKPYYKENQPYYNRFMQDALTLLLQKFSARTNNLPFTKQRFFEIYQSGNFSRSYWNAKNHFEATEEKILNHALGLNTKSGFFNLHKSYSGKRTKQLLEHELKVDFKKSYSL